MSFSGKPAASQQRLGALSGEMVGFFRKTLAFPGHGELFPGNWELFREVLSFSGNWKLSNKDWELFQGNGVLFLENF